MVSLHVPLSRLVLSIVAIAALAVAQSSADADVLVYGATPGGCCAAIAAAREGATVLLVEPTDHVGGLSTGGLSHCDSNQMVRSTVMGLFHEWHVRIVADYTARGLPAPYDPTRKDQARWTFEPHVALRVTRAMLDEAGVVVRGEEPLAAVERDGPRITAIRTTGGRFTARTFVDASYEGDLMAAAGVDWVIGREGREDFGESLAGRRYPKPVMPIDGFDAEGEPLPLITATARGDDAAGDGGVMTYSFRLCLTREPDNRVPMPAPAAYDPARFELLRRALGAGVRRIGFDLYPLPGGKFDGNNSIGGQFSLGLVGGSENWHAADAAGRARIFAAHREYTLELFHFLTTDPAVPDSIRNRFAGLGLCKDEFVTHDHFPPALYVRESRRLRGLHVLSQRDILEQPEKDDPIAVSSFPIDSHDCRRIALPGGGVVNEGTIFPVRRTSPKQGYAYQVPYRALLPRAAQADNLLVPVALSSTHVAMSSLRIEGTWMVLGQSAGVAAALTAAADVAVQELPYPRLRERLLAQGQVLDLPPTPTDPPRLPGVLDDADAELSGPWLRSSRFPHVGAGYRHDDRRGDGSCEALFRFTPDAAGRYELRIAYSPHPTRATNVPVRVVTGTEETRITVDQTQPLPEGELLRTVGELRLESGVEARITIGNAGTDGFVIVDAIQLRPVSR